MFRPSVCDKREVIKKISSFDNVAFICNYVGPQLHVLISSESDESLDQTGRKITELSSGGQPIWAQRPTSKIRTALSRTDWQIIKSLLQDPWKPHDQIAKEVRISARTTRKRVAKLAEEGAIQLSVDFNFSAFKGIVPGTLIVLYSRDEERSQVNRRIAEYVGDDLFFAELGDPMVGVFALSAPNMAWLEDVGDFVRSQPGVKACRALVLRDIIALNNMGEAETENMISEAAYPKIPAVTNSDAKNPAFRKYQSRIVA